eukprot:3001600-Rhodomonas_salina.2
MRYTTTIFWRNAKSWKREGSLVRCRGRATLASLDSASTPQIAATPDQGPTHARSAPTTHKHGCHSLHRCRHNHMTATTAQQSVAIGSNRYEAEAVGRSEAGWTAEKVKDRCQQDSTQQWQSAYARSASLSATTCYAGTARV